MMRRRSALLGALASALSMLVPAAGSAAGTRTYELHMEVPNVAQAPNGDQVALTGEGVFQVHPKGVEASGGFTHTDSDGNLAATGTWQATKLRTYQSYGGVVLGNELPADFCGGKMKMRVLLTPDGTSLQIKGTLTVFCIIGTNPPASHDDPSGEGVTLVANFNKIVSGMNVYIRTS
jgi:hypothetical protein